MAVFDKKHKICYNEYWLYSISLQKEGAMKSFKICEHALIMGASSEIGSACAEHLAVRGTKVLTLTYGSNLGLVEALGARLTQEHGTLVHLMQVTFPFTDDDVPIFAQQLEEVFEKTGHEIDAMVNCIGVSPNLDLSRQKIGGALGWLEVLNINLISATFAMRVVYERMRRKGVKGAIVQIASTNGVNSFAQFSAHYDASKAGLILVTRNLAQEFAKQGVRVNAISPGWIKTKLNHDVPNLDDEIAKVWMHRLGTVDEVAHAVLFALENTFLTGTNINLDGGYSG